MDAELPAAGRGLIATLRALTPRQRTAVWASYLGWTLDAFDFFLLVFMVKAIAEAFHTEIKPVSEALFLTLAMRPVGALVVGMLGDRFGRRPLLMLVILAFSLLSAASGFARSLSELLLIRAAFGFAMGGEWGLGASLVMESVPPGARGAISGLLQAGYATGYLLAAIAYYLLFDALGWRAMFLLGLAPALLVVFIRMKVEESPGFAARAAPPKFGEFVAALAANWKLALYLIVLMSAFNFFSHGVGDLYPTFLQKQHHFDTHTTGMIAALHNVGALVGAVLFGTLSETLGRRRAIMLAAACAVPVIPLWAYGQQVWVLALGNMLIGAAVQGAWAMVPAYLNELSPPAVRAMFPGFVYQLGNLIASRISPIQAGIAEAHGGDFRIALAGTTLITVAVLIGWSALGPERRGEVLV